MKKKQNNDLMPKSQMYVIITQVHKTARDFLDKNHPDLSVQGYVYDYIMNKYGIKKIADKKFRQFCSAIRKYKEANHRSYLFGRFMGIFKPLEKSNFIEYTEIKETINGFNIGFMPNNIDSDAAHFVPYIRTTKYMSMHLEGSMSQENYKKFSKRVEKIKRNDKKGKNTPGIINIDQFIMLLFNNRAPKSTRNSVVNE